MTDLKTVLKSNAIVIYNEYGEATRGPTVVVKQMIISNEDLKDKLEQNKIINQCIYDTRNSSFLKTAKHPFSNKLPIEMIQSIIEYIPVVTKKMISYCKWCYLNHLEVKINEVIMDNKFDRLWHDIGTIDYKWTSDTIKEANDQLQDIQNQKKSYLKIARYSPI